MDFYQPRGGNRPIRINIYIYIYIYGAALVGTCLRTDCKAASVDRSSTRYLSTATSRASSWRSGTWQRWTFRSRRPVISSSVLSRLSTEFISSMRDRPAQREINHLACTSLQEFIGVVTGRTVGHCPEMRIVLRRRHDWILAVVILIVGSETVPKRAG